MSSRGSGSVSIGKHGERRMNDPPFRHNLDRTRCYSRDSWRYRDTPSDSCPEGCTDGPVTGYEKWGG